MAGNDPLKPVSLQGTPPLRALEPPPAPPVSRLAETRFPMPPPAPPIAAPPPLVPPMPTTPSPHRPSHSAVAVHFNSTASTSPVVDFPSGQRNVRRRPCGFPGMLRVLMPEQSFVPHQLAVRVMDLSPSGARIETRQLSRDLYMQMSLEPRFVRLEIMIPSREKITVSGKLIWTDFKEEVSILGISIAPRREDLAESCLPEWRPDIPTDSKFISPPTIESYPASTGKQRYTFRGSVLDGTEIHVEHAMGEMRVPVRDMRFEVEVPLAPAQANEIKFSCVDGTSQSEPTPVWIYHRPGISDTQSVRFAGIFEELLVSGNGRTLKIKFHGDPNDLTAGLKKIEEILPMIERGSITIDLTGHAEAAAQKLRKPKF